MKNFNKKNIVIAILGIVFLAGATLTQAVWWPSFMSPSLNGPGVGTTPVPPAYVTGFEDHLIMNKNTESSVFSQTGTTTLGRTLALDMDNLDTYVGLVTDGIYSFGPVRAMGKLTATLVPVSLSGYDAREVMSLKGGVDSGILSFLTNTNYVGFFGQNNFDASYNSGDHLSLLDIYNKAITNLLFGRVNIKKLVVSPYDPYATTTKDFALYGTTNLGKGDICYLPVPAKSDNTVFELPQTYTNPVYENQAYQQYSCPQGWYMKAPGSDGYSQAQAQDEVDIVCQRISPSPVPGSNAGPTPPAGMMNDYSLCPNYIAQLPVTPPADILNQKMYKYVTVNGVPNSGLQPQICLSHTLGYQVEVDGWSFHYDEPCVSASGATSCPYVFGDGGTGQNGSIFIDPGNLCGTDGTTWTYWGNNYGFTFGTTPPQPWMTPVSVWTGVGNYYLGGSITSASASVEPGFNGLP